MAIGNRTAYFAKNALGRADLRPKDLIKKPIARGRQNDRKEMISRRAQQ